MKVVLKHVLLAGLCTCAAFAGVFLSCVQDKCKSVNCAYGGICIEGVCNCYPGYEGANCETVSRKKFISNLWQVNEKGTSSPGRQYPVAIEPDTSITTVFIKNFYNYFNSRTIRAIIDMDTLTIPTQQVAGKVITGKGYLHASPGSSTNNMITISYIVLDSATRNVIDDFGYNNGFPSVWIK